MSTLRSILHTAPRSTIEHGLSFIDFSPPVNGSTPKAAATGNMPGMLGPSYERSGHPQRKRAHEGHRKANIIHTHTHNVYIYIYPSFLTFTLSCPCLLLRQQSFAPADGHKANVDNALSDISNKGGNGTPAATSQGQKSKQLALSRLLSSKPRDLRCKQLGSPHAKLS